MKTYKKRIGFLISDQHLIPHGGIGQFAKAFTEMCERLNWKVDIIVDKQPTNEFSKLLETCGANIIYPDDCLRYNDHTQTFSFSDTINFEKIVNFRKSIMKAFSTNIYDMLVCNTQESMSAAYAMTVNKYIPVVFYTHLHSMIFRESQGSDVFLDSYHNFYNKHMEFSDIIIGTQSQKNIDELSKYGATNCKLLPMPMPERGLLSSSHSSKKEGVLFIGRWEEGKNPEAYIKAMKECGLPCKVMTNSNGKKKFEHAFNEAGIIDYEIKAGITGQEKVDFIKGCKVFFMPSLRENYPFAFMECLGHMHCIVLDKQDWSDNFDEILFTKTTQDKVPEKLKELYNTEYVPYGLGYVQLLDEKVETDWKNFLENFDSKKSKSNAAKILKYETVCYKDFLADLNRTNLAREDFESVLSNRHKFTVTYTDTNTYLSTDPTFVPVETDNTDIFEF